jgi:hypothetical protein
MRDALCLSRFVSWKNSLVEQSVRAYYVEGKQRERRREEFCAAHYWLCPDLTRPAYGHHCFLAREIVEHPSPHVGYAYVNISISILIYSPSLIVHSGS